MMTLFNNLNTVQEIKIRDRDNTYYSAFIESRKSVALESYQITDDIRSKIDCGKLTLLGVDLAKQSPRKVEVVVENKVKLSDEDINDKENSTKDTIVEEEIVEESEALEEVAEIEEETSLEDGVNEEDNPTNDVYVCKICGNEYASEKGLSMHMSRTHANK